MKEQLETFQRERILIGEGRMTRVYLWKGYAYKCFQEDYPSDMIVYEKKIQDIISNTSLPVVKYYESEFPHSIKMDYVKGITMMERINQGGYDNWDQEFLSLFQAIHQVEGQNLPLLKPYLEEQISKLSFESGVKKTALTCLQELPEGNRVCHLDYHFLNLIYSEEKYFVIDWINAHCGNPILDAARAYVILYEFANPLAERFLELYEEKNSYQRQDIDKAILVMALHRLTETESDKVKELILAKA